MLGKLNRQIRNFVWTGSTAVKKLVAVTWPISCSSIMKGDGSERPEYSQCSYVGIFWLAFYS